MYVFRYQTKTAIAMALMASLTACGGGAAPPASPSPPVQQPVPPPPPAPVPPPSLDFNTAEFRRNYGLGQINAIPAYEAGATGEGVIVSVIDTGIDLNHIDLIGRIHPASTNSFDISLGAQDADGHGTLVAGVIAANRNNSGTHGVAFEAQILSVRAEDPDTCEEEDGCQLFDRDIARGIDIARQNGARIINLSLGGDGAGFSVLNAVDRATSAGIIIVISAGNTDDDTTPGQQANPTGFAQLGLSSAANGRVIIVGATDQNQFIADFSHHAGIAQNIFVVAPGVRVPTTNVGGGIALASGTSFSAPHVSGALALLFDLFPNLSTDEVIELLLTSTQDLGANGTDNIFGRGLIDVGAAIAPRGIQRIAVAGANDTTTTALPGTIALPDSGAQTPGAIGDALSHIPELGRSVFLDDYQRGYFTDLTARLTMPHSTARLLPRLRQDLDYVGGSLTLGNTILRLSAFGERQDQQSVREIIGGAALDTQRTTTSRFAFSGVVDGIQFNVAHGYSLGEQLEEHPDQQRFLSLYSFATPYLSESANQQSLVLSRPFAGGRLSFGASHVQNDTYSPVLFGPEPLHDIAAQTIVARFEKPLEHGHFAFALGAKHEHNQILGGVSAGALRLGEGANTSFASISAEHDLSNIFYLALQMSYGITTVQDTPNSLFENISTIHTSAFSVGLFSEHLLSVRDQAAFSISQPLRAEKGVARLNLPNEIHYAPGQTTILFQEINAGLTPSGREFDMELSYRWAFGAKTRLGVNVMHQFDAGHVKGQNAMAALVRLNHVF